MPILKINKIDMEKRKIKTYTLEELTDKYIGETGTPEREKFEFELKLEILGSMIRNARKEKHLTQEELGKLIGVQKAQISKIENNAKDVRFSTILRVFEALEAKVQMSIEFDKSTQISIA
jgi:DNA-binding XRE family transcriptional regulator